ncbi:hypothetical protein AgCh_012049 [Apium graveolens]
MEQGRGSISSQGSTPSASMLPPRPESTFNTEEDATSSRQSSHVWTYFSKEAMLDNPNRFKVHCLICVQNGRPQPPFSYARGTGTGTLSRHLENIHSITKASHESGEARRGPQQSQLGGFMTSTGGGGEKVFVDRGKVVDVREEMEVIPRKCYRGDGGSYQLIAFVTPTADPQGSKEMFRVEIQPNECWTVGSTVSARAFKIFNLPQDFLSYTARKRSEIVDRCKSVARGFIVDFTYILEEFKKDVSDEDSSTLKAEIVELKEAKKKVEI